MKKPKDKKIENKKINKSKKKTVFKAVGIPVVVIALAGSAFLLYNCIANNHYNSTPPAKDPFTSDHVWDNNGNDIQIGDDGNIITDQLSETDKQILTAQMKNLVLQDANSRLENSIDSVDDILSISLLPYNLFEKDNEFDKYYLSILFSDKGETYTLNYLTGKDSPVTTQDFCKDSSSKDTFADFIHFLNYECALDTCEKMNGSALAVKNALQGDVVHVGNTYCGYEKSGDEYYYIPIYHQDGTCTIYNSWTSPIDGQDLDPMEEFLKEITNPTIESNKKYFQCLTDWTTENSQTIENLNNIVQLWQKIKTPEQQNSAQNESSTKNNVVVKKQFKEKDLSK